MLSRCGWGHTLGVVTSLKLPPPLSEYQGAESGVQFSEADVYAIQGNCLVFAEVMSVSRKVWQLVLLF